MRIFYILLILGSFHLAQAQEVKLIQLDELETRIRNGKDSFYIINYWATWCVPCIKELPYFDRFQQEHANQRVKVLLISLDFLSQYQKAVIPFVKKKGIRSEVFLLNEKDQQSYIDRISPKWSGALPATAFINRAKDTSLFFEEPFTYESLVKTYQSIK